jgi:CMP-N-acetylneuraminic acid synthetase
MVALIPARGGSKRIPRKNILPFFGQPLIAYAIAAARNSGLFARVVVSTDDHEIAAVARDFGAEVVQRPPELAHDRAMLVDVTLHALAALGVAPAGAEVFCQLMPNCPLRRSADVREHHDVFVREKRLFQISAVPYRCVYPQWALACDAAGVGRWQFGRDLSPSEDLGPLVCPTGAIWWARTAEFLIQRAFYGEPFHVEPMDANRGLDIDTREDLELAELVVRGLWSRDGVCPLEPVGLLRGDER